MRGPLPPNGERPEADVFGLDRPPGSSLMVKLSLGNRLTLKPRSTLNVSSKNGSDQHGLESASSANRLSAENQMLESWRNVVQDTDGNWGPVASFPIGELPKRLKQSKELLGEKAQLKEGRESTEEEGIEKGELAIVAKRRAFLKSAGAPLRRS